MSVYQSVYKIVQSIPKGRVLTYGLISNLLGGRLSAQGVGWALRALPAVEKPDNPRHKKPVKKDTLKIGVEPEYSSDTVPWHRVINSRGGISTRRILGLPWDLQRELLEREGVLFDHEEKTDLEKYLWWQGLKSLDKPGKSTVQIDEKVSKRRKAAK